MSKVYEIVTEKIIALLEQGTVPWRKPWSTAGAPRNLVSRKPYRGINALLLASNPFSSPYYATFRQIVERGGRVLRGEKASLVVFYKKYEKEIEDEDGDVETRNIYLLRYYNLFNLDQTDGVKAPEDGRPEEHNFVPVEKAQEIIGNIPDPPRIVHGGSEAYYRPRTDSVHLPVPERFKTSEEYYAATFHELVHSTGHTKRLCRPGVADFDCFGSHQYSREELIAEMGAAFLCNASRIDRPLDNFAAYIANWLEVLKLKENRKLVVTAASQAQKAADYILNHSQALR